MPYEERLYCFYGGEEHINAQAVFEVVCGLSLKINFFF